MIDYSGTEEIGISSLSTGDYPCLGPFSILLPEVEKERLNFSSQAETG